MARRTPRYFETVFGERSAFAPIHSCTSLGVIVAGSKSEKVGLRRASAFPYMRSVSSATSTRLPFHAVAHSANVRVLGVSASARRTSAGLRPAASSPAIRSRRTRASFNVPKAPPCSIG
jgi:hypothetical protein